jgi:hypothetical protein
VNYGAFYVRSDYRHVNGYLSWKRKLRLKDIAFYRNGQPRRFTDPRNWRHCPSLLRFFWLLWRFSKRYAAFRKTCETKSQKHAMAEDPWIQALYHEPAADMIRRLGIEFWSDRYFMPVISSTTFQSIEQISAFYFLASCLPFIIPAYQFEFHLEKLIAPFYERILRQEVTAVERTAVERTAGESACWQVKTGSHERFHCDNLILATPINVTRRLIGLNESTNPPSAMYYVHVRGRRRPDYSRKELFLFDPDHNHIALVHEPNDTSLVYSRIATPDLERFFIDHEVIARGHWDPAFFLGSHLLESDRGEGLYLIGDHSICCLEDAYITGLYSAGQVLKGYSPAS